MGMTERDRKVLAVVLVLIVLGGFWFLVVHKKQTAISAAETELTTAQAEQASAKAALLQAKELSEVKPASYNKLVRLGKAVPNNDDFQSLLIQVNDISDDAKVNFVSLSANTGASGSGVAGSGGTTCDSGSSSSTGASGATAAPAPAPEPAPTAATGSTGGSTSATGSTGTSRTSSSKAASCSTAPTLTDITAKSAGLVKYEYSFVFDGSFFRLHTVFDNILELVKVNNGRVGVTGRLLDISSINITTKSFPELSATVAMTGYSIPPTTTVDSSAAAAAAAAPAATGTQASE